ncbi:MAG: membrane protein insertion efficiency factor YidD [Rhizobiales bacterium]|nr:membrane protein insertion efficiency factor YidD [Hyphomicrobiales bacterium]
MTPAPRASLLLAVARIPRVLGIGAIKGYRVTLSSLIGRQCRYLPTCSEYAEEAVRRYGLWAGSWMALSRLQRCGPMGASGYDPVPDAPLPGARWYLPWRYGHWTGKHIHPDIIGWNLQK